jgi:hypothetical protein
MWTFGLKKRSDAKESLIYVVKRLKNSLVQIRVDGARCFNRAKEFLAKHVEQNGKVERVHLTIDSKVVI